MLEIDCAGERLGLLPEKAVFWSRTKTLIVADLHLGKAAAFRQLGIGVPENTTGEDLSRLARTLAETASERLIILGDFFHASAGLQREMMDAFSGWRKQHAKIDILLVRGNHDRRAGDPPASWKIELAGDSRLVSPFLLRHEPEKRPEGYVLAGHIHPAISLSEKFGGGIRAPCFCFGERCAILPAFGSFTGMRNIDRRKGDRIFAIGSDQVIAITS